MAGAFDGAGRPALILSCNGRDLGASRVGDRCGGCDCLPKHAFHGRILGGDLVECLADPAVQDTAEIVGERKALFDLVQARGMEGIVAGAA